MDHSKSTTIKEIFTAEEISASGSAYSDIIPAGKLAGNASLELVVTGDGTALIELVESNDLEALVAAFIVPEGIDDIVTAFTKTSGPGGNGKHIIPFSLALALRFAIKITETGGANSVTVTATLAVQ